MMMIKENERSFPIRVGIIGVGSWATYGHIPALQSLPDYEVVVLQSRRRDAAEAAAARFNIPHVAATVDELVHHPAVQLVLVLTTAPQHEAGVLAAIAAGKDVYSEWPFTITSEKAKALLSLAKAAGVKHMIGLQRRFAPVFLYLRDLIQEGYVGQLRSVRLHVSMNGFQATRSLAWTVPPENFSDVIAIYGGHFLDALFASIGRPKTLSAVLVNQFPIVVSGAAGITVRTTTPDQLIMSGNLDGTAVYAVHVEGGKRNGSGVQLDITGDQGDIRVTNESAFGGVGQDYQIKGAHGNKLALETLEIPEIYRHARISVMPSAVQELAALYAAYAAGQRHGMQTVGTFEDAVWLHHLFDQMRESSETGNRVIVQE